MRASLLSLSFLRTRKYVPNYDQYNEVSKHECRVAISNAARNNKNLPRFFARFPVEIMRLFGSLDFAQ